jgi:hypothetical protein
VSNGGTLLNATNATDQSRIKIISPHPSTEIPTAVGITVTASPFAWQNLQMEDGSVVISGGVVSNIQYSTDGTNYFTTGLTSGIFPVGAAHFLQVTYSGTPTMTFMPPKW